MGIQRTRFELEALEPRVYLSAEHGAVALAAAASHGASHWYAERATGLAHHSTLSEDFSYQDDSEGLFAGVTSSTSAATTHTHSHHHKQLPAASHTAAPAAAAPSAARVSVAANPVIKPAASAASSSSPAGALVSGASRAGISASVSSILPDLATALSSNIFPTDAT